MGQRMTEPLWAKTAPAELLNEADAYIELIASAYDAIAILPGIGGLLRDAWAAVRPQPSCDCPMDPHHRWNCELTPVWAQLMRESDFNPWTALWMPLSERDFQTLWRRAGQDPIRHTRMIEGREHTSWYMPATGLIFETVAPANPPLTGMLERFLEFERANQSAECTCAMTESSMRACDVHGERDAER